MSDVRARLAEALRSHFLLSDSPLRCNCGWHVPVQSSTIGRDFELHLTDVLLSLPGIAIVELPEAHEDVRIYKRSIWTLTNAFTPGYAREIAAALLAAANAAEVAK